MQSLKNRKNILLITNFSGMWPFSNKLSEIYNENGFETFVLDYGEHEYFNFRDNKKESYFKKNKRLQSSKIGRHLQNVLMFPLYFKKKLAEIGTFHAVVILYHHDFLNDLATQISKLSEKIILIYAGSDFYRVSEQTRKKNRSLLNLCTKIVFTNSGMANDVTAYYNDYRHKFTVNQFGLNVIDCLIDNKINIVREKIRITIGYNGTEQQQHLLIIKAIAEVVKRDGREPELVIPLTYGGSPEYIGEIKNLVTHLNIAAVFFERKLSDAEIAELRTNSDIVINMQLSDQASGSLVEYIATGNIMIIANWLSYVFWDDFKFYYHKTDFDGLAKKLEGVLSNYEEEKERSRMNIPTALNNFSSKSRLKEALAIVE